MITQETDFLEGGKLLLGSPAKVIRDLEDYELANIRKSAEAYQVKSTLFKKNIKKCTWVSA